MKKKPIANFKSNSERNQNIINHCQNIQEKNPHKLLAFRYKRIIKCLQSRVLQMEAELAERRKEFQEIINNPELYKIKRKEIKENSTQTNEVRSKNERSGVFDNDNNSLSCDISKEEESNEQKMNDSLEKSLMVEKNLNGILRTQIVMVRGKYKRLSKELVQERKKNEELSILSLEQKQEFENEFNRLKKGKEKRIKKIKELKYVIEKNSSVVNKSRECFSRLKEEVESIELNNRKLRNENGILKNKIRELSHIKEREINESVFEKERVFEEISNTSEMENSSIRDEIDLLKKNYEKELTEKKSILFEKERVEKINTDIVKRIEGLQRLLIQEQKEIIILTEKKM